MEGRGRHDPVLQCRRLCGPSRPRHGLQQRCCNVCPRRWAWRALAGRSAQHLSWTAERRARLSPHRVFAAAAGARRSPHAPRKEVPSSTRVDPLPQSRPPPRILRNQRNSLVARSAPAFRGERAPSHALVNVRRHVTSRRGFSTFSVGACFSRFAHTRPLPCFTVWLCTGGGGQGPSGESRRWRSRGERLAGVVS